MHRRAALHMISKSHRRNWTTRLKRSFPRFDAEFYVINLQWTNSVVHGSPEARERAAPLTRFDPVPLTPRGARSIGGNSYHKTP
jgi:hypothetical protein